MPASLRVGERREDLRKQVTVHHPMRLNKRIHDCLLAARDADGEALVCRFVSEPSRGRG
jgi:hypothetical protein